MGYINSRFKIFIVAGARPNFMKIAPLWEEIQKHSAVSADARIVHTGQHYDDSMSDVFLRDLGMPRPHISFNVGSGTHAGQTAAVMSAFENLCLRENPDLVIVVGDVNSTLACALVAAKLPVPVAHVEAGLRSYDRSMPEEVNRVVTDAVSDYLFTTSRDAVDNLKREGIAENKICFAGNVMIDTLFKFKEIAGSESPFKSVAGDYALLTLHRPANVDDENTFRGMLDAIRSVSEKIPIIFPAHPRTSKLINKFGFGDYFTALNTDLKEAVPENGINLLPPVSYLDMVALMMNARFVLTDSGGLQEETTGLGVPCITLRENTERPVTISEGTNILAGRDPDKIYHESMNVLKTGGKRGRVPDLWDGRAAQRIVKRLLDELN